MKMKTLIKKPKKGKVFGQTDRRRDRPTNEATSRV